MTEVKRAPGREQFSVFCWNSLLSVVLTFFRPTETDAGYHDSDGTCYRTCQDELPQDMELLILEKRSSVKYLTCEKQLFIYFYLFILQISREYTTIIKHEIMKDSLGIYC